MILSSPSNYANALPGVFLFLFLLFLFVVVDIQVFQEDLTAHNTPRWPKDGAEFTFGNWPTIGTDSGDTGDKSPRCVVG